MSDKKLTDAQIQQLAEQWYRQKDQPLEPWPELNKMVPFSELPKCGIGLLAAVISLDRLSEDPDGRDANWLGLELKHCQNCGQDYRASKVEDGWCDYCSQATSKLLTYDAEWSCELSADSLIDYLTNLEMYDEELIQLTARNTGRHALNVLGRESKSEAA